MNRNVKMLSRLYSPSLKNVGWIEDAQLIFLIFYTFVCTFFLAPSLLPCQIYRQMYGKLEKLIAPSPQTDGGRMSYKRL